MAKTAKVKKREVSLHSRAARRGASPPSKDLAVKPAAVEETEYKPWLHSTQNAGISKKTKKKQLTRQQKQRQQRGLENAERNMDKHEKKVADSKTRGKKIKARRTDWEDLNEKLGWGGGKENESKDEEKKEVGAAEAGVEKGMDGVEMPNLDQELPVRVAEEQTEELVEKLKEAELVPLPPSEDVDEVT